MKVFYDNQVDALYIMLGEEKPEGVSELAEGVNLDITQNGKLVGIEIIDASKKINIETILSYSLELDKDLLNKSAA